MNQPAPTATLPPLTGKPLMLGTLALSLATFMNVLDSSIANVSIPAIAGDLGVSPNQGTWVITSFAVANAISLPLTGWLTQRFGQVRLFIMSVLLFVLASCLCGLAQSMPFLIFFRIVQGAVAGPMIPLSQTILLSSYPKAKAGTALAIWSMTTLVAPVMGPLLGGWITDHINWSWIFYINIPIGLGAALVTWLIYRTRETPTRRLPIDYVGLTLLVVWIGALQIMLDLGKDEDWFESNTIIILALVAAVGFVFFIIWELTDKHPVVDLSLFRGLNFTIGTFSLALAYGVFFGSIVLLPLWLQQYMGYTATWAGMLLAPIGLFSIMLMPLVGKMIGHRDPRMLATFSFAVFALVFWMRSGFTPQADFWSMAIPTYIQGIAMAFFFIPLMSIAFSGLDPARIPSASGLANFVRISAGAFGTSIATTMWDSRASLHHSNIASSLNAHNDTFTHTLNQMQHLGLSLPQARAWINRLIDVQAFTLGVTDMFYLAALLCLMLIPFVWLSRPKSRAAVDTGGAH